MKSILAIFLSVCAVYACILPYIHSSALRIMETSLHHVSTCENKVSHVYTWESSMLNKDSMRGERQNQERKEIANSTNERHNSLPPRSCSSNNKDHALIQIMAARAIEATTAQLYIDCFSYSLTYSYSSCVVIFCGLRLCYAQSHSDDRHVHATDTCSATAPYVLHVHSLRLAPHAMLHVFKAVSMQIAV